MEIKIIHKGPTLIEGKICTFGPSEFKKAIENHLPGIISKVKYTYSFKDGRLENRINDIYCESPEEALEIFQEKFALERNASNWKIGYQNTNHLYDVNSWFGKDITIPKTKHFLLRRYSIIIRHENQWKKDFFESKKNEK